jgi:hypothetical protein
VDVLQQLVLSDSSPDHLVHPLVDDLACPVIQYVDNTLLLLRADPKQLIRATELLDSFSRATGLGINFQKSSFVPIHVPATEVDGLAALFGYSVLEFPQTYLSLPLTAAKLRVQDLQHLVVKIQKRAPGWKSASAGEAVLTSDTCCVGVGGRPGEEGEEFPHTERAPRGHTSSVPEIPLETSTDPMVKSAPPAPTPDRSRRNRAARVDVI